MTGESQKKSIKISVTDGSENDPMKKDDPEEVIKSSRTEADAGYLEQLQRLQAEFTNYKRRIEKEWESYYSRAQGDLVQKLLPVLDDFERLTLHHEHDAHCSMQGVILIYQKMQKVLQDEGLSAIEAIGQPFDPECHEGIGVEATSKDKDETVLEDWQSGYRFGGRLLRPSRVKVGRYEGNE